MGTMTVKSVSKNTTADNVNETCGLTINLGYTEDMSEIESLIKEGK